MKTLKVDDLLFEIRFSPKRKAVQLTVDRDGELVISAPEGCSRKDMRDFVREKKFWVYTKLAEKELLRKPIRKKEFVTGEGFPYLGRNYRLLLVDRQDAQLKLVNGRFRLLRKEARRGREHFIDWYSQHALSWIKPRLARFAERLGVTPSGIEIRDLGFRWGSCSQNGTVNFHWATILQPPRIVEYIVVHELAHQHEGHHTPVFWRHVERTMPDYEIRKEWLARHAHTTIA